MKNKLIIKMFIIGIVALFIFSCKQKKDSGGGKCEIIIPKDVKAIDYDNYNDVLSVFWNYNMDCSDENSDIGKNIKIYGWIFQGPNYPDGKPKQVEPEQFNLISDKEDIFGWNAVTRGGKSIEVSVYSGGSLEEMEALIASIKTKFASVDITKKCYIIGSLSSIKLPDENCCRTEPKILIHNVDDIKFEEE